MALYVATGHIPSPCGQKEHTTFITPKQADKLKHFQQLSCLAFTREEKPGCPFWYYPGAVSTTIASDYAACVNMCQFRFDYFLIAGGDS